MTRRLLPFVLAVAALPAPGAVEVPQVVDPGEPRAYGYQVGDTARRRVVLELPTGWTLDAASLPRPGGRGRALELRRVSTQATGVDGGTRHVIELDYQVFIAPTTVRVFEMPAFVLHARGAQRDADLRVDAWPVSVAPLLPPEAPMRRGLGELQPDRAPPLLDTRTLQVRLASWAALATLLLGWLAWAHLGPPWRAARNQPFGRAWRALRGLPPRPDAERWRAACRSLHEALNRSAGEVLYAHGLDRFVAARPAFAALRDDLARFLALSRREFFGNPAAELRDGRWLLELCRRCRDAERGLA